MSFHQVFKMYVKPIIKTCIAILLNRSNEFFTQLVYSPEWKYSYYIWSLTHTIVTAIAIVAFLQPCPPATPVGPQPAEGREGTQLGDNL